MGRRPKHPRHTAPRAPKAPELTVKNTATFVSASSKQFTCETSGAGANYIETTTEATWTGEKTHDNHPVRQTSIVTVPPAASIEVKLKDEDNNPVEGATVEVREEGKSTGTTAAHARKRLRRLLRSHRRAER